MAKATTQGFELQGKVFVARDKLRVVQSRRLRRDRCERSWAVGLLATVELVGHGANLWILTVICETLRLFIPAVV